MWFQLAFNQLSWLASPGCPLLGLLPTSLLSIHAPLLIPPPRRSCVFGALGGRNSLPKVPLPPSHLAGSVPVLVRDPNSPTLVQHGSDHRFEGKGGRGRGRQTHTQEDRERNREGIQSIPRSQPWLVSVSISVLSVF
ncbi:hypothetical protein BO85DRAFT_264134 [Aspergillus piperis CBS 112811]|uniref:Uncharacterized protein n=1 Tax=Aspergillus piperis CBS 112811 TaxID=1448313 RepID=A0A8G1R9F2_9EURO|nr:hypothetical protein BO85DRAFT_264134 [Aspergillus piperis CBS 112811]RAH59185.1 hypothetical protein BO85DRAFT_264134 [Aspergillus piperis CBS 112811]